MRFGYAALLALPLVLTGCAVGPTTSPSPEPGVAVTGSVHGGQQPIVGAHVYLFAANTTGYAGPGISPSSGNASVSLLNSSSTGASDSLGAYVTTGAGGKFSITGDYTCTPNAQVYIYALGGNPGAGTNPAAGLMAALGNCPGSGTFSSSSFININEVTTAAAAYAFAGFASDATHVSSSSTALAKVGIQNAFANAANLVDVSTGAALATTPAGNGTAPQSLLNTLGNILAACVNTTGAVTGPTNPTPCYTLFNNAQANGSSGTVPSDTATAAINVAHNPGVNVSTLYSLATAVAPFSPALSSAPNDFTVGIEFTGGGLNNPQAIAIDGSGNVWVSNIGGSNGLISELSPTGVALSPAGGYVVSTSNLVDGIAIDPSGNVWGTAYYAHAIVELSNSGTILSGSNGYTGGSLSAPYAIAVDGAGYVWATDSSAPSVVKLSSAGSVQSGSSGYTGGNLSNPYGIALDPSGNAWIVNRDSNTVTKFSNSGALLSGSSGYSGGGINTPYSLAIDHSGNVWIASYGGLASSNISELSSSGTAISPSGGYQGGGVDSPQSIAIDGAGQAWVANLGSLRDVAEFSNSGTAMSPSTGYTGGNLNSPGAIAVDGSGNVWVTNTYNNSTNHSTVSELIGAAAPVVTPLSAGVENNTLGTRP